MKTILMIVPLLLVPHMAIAQPPPGIEISASASHGEVALKCERVWKDLLVFAQQVEGNKQCLSQISAIDNEDMKTLFLSKCRVTVEKWLAGNGPKVSIPVEVFIRGFRELYRPRVLALNCEDKMTPFMFKPVAAQRETAGVVESQPSRSEHCSLPGFSSFPECR